jgi:thioredoxin-dependent peroxiredoxin
MGVRVYIADFGTGRRIIAQDSEANSLRWNGSDPGFSFSGGRARLAAMKLSLVIGTIVALWVASPAVAALKPGTYAPDFSAPASLAGKEFQFSLAAALRKGPVVLYFYPAAFTEGCTLEAHEFAEASDQFAALNATVIGVSRDEIEVLNRFSVSECRNKFPVAADVDGSISKAFDAVLNDDYANRTSYVIAPEGQIIYEYTNLDYSKHVGNALAALKAWKKNQE